MKCKTLMHLVGAWMIAHYKSKTKY